MNTLFQECRTSLGLQSFRKPGRILLFFGLFAYLFTSSAVAQTAVEPYHIGVWYFTLWGTHALSSMQAMQAQATYETKPDPWGGVREYNENRGIIPPTSPQFGQYTSYASRRPLLGFYDLANQATVDQQIEEAASAGIDFFAFYWYADSVSGQENPVSSVIEKFFNSSKRQKIKFVIAPIIIGESPIMSLQIWEKAIVPQIVHYMSYDAYYRINGRPLIVDFTWPFGSLTDDQQGYEFLRHAAESALGVNPFIVSLLGGDNTWNDMSYRRAFVKPDGFTCFGAPIAGNPERYGHYIRKFPQFMTTQITSPSGYIDPTLVYMPCGSIGQDARPWWQIGWGNWVYPTITDRPYNTGVTLSLWKEHMIDIKSFIDSRRTRSYNIAFLYAWNEWGESAKQIEPSKLNGTYFVDTVAEVFGLSPR